MTIDLKITKAEQARLDREYAKERLLTHYLKPGDTVYTVLRKVSSSGMTRHYSLVVASNGKIDDITYYASKAIEWPLVESTGHRAIKVSGCGMDMSFHLVSTLSAVLFRGQERADYILREDKL
jgi:hypothetical protein